MKKFYITFVPEEGHTKPLGLCMEAVDFNEAFKLGYAGKTLLHLSSGNLWRMGEITEQKRRGIEYVS